MNWAQTGIVTGKDWWYPRSPKPGDPGHPFVVVELTARDAGQLPTLSL
jgi:hypothetical protein